MGENNANKALYISIADILSAAFKRLKVYVSGTYLSYIRNLNRIMNLYYVEVRRYCW